jgi:hypothetical protein
VIDENPGVADVSGQHIEGCVPRDLCICYTLAPARAAEVRKTLHNGSTIAGDAAATRIQQTGGYSQ